MVRTLLVLDIELHPAVRKDMVTIVRKTNGTQPVCDTVLCGIADVARGDKAIDQLRSEVAALIATVDSQCAANITRLSISSARS